MNLEVENVVGEIECGHVRRGRGRPSAQEIILRLTHEIEDVKRENAELRARLADHFYSVSVPVGAL